MSDVTTTQANRLRRPTWKDSRLLVGLLLVLLSTALGGFVVSRAEDTVPVYAAKADLVPGQALGDGDAAGRCPTRRHHGALPERRGRSARACTPCVPSVGVSDLPVVSG